jgi:hypothetical protein
VSARSSFLALAAVALGGCFADCRVHDDPDVTEPVSAPPIIETVDVPSWPPLGRDAQVRVHVGDDQCLSDVLFQFAEAVDVPIGGTDDWAAVSGLELGEGMGTLWIEAGDCDGGTDGATVTNLVVDLTPPTIELGATTVPASGGQVEIWAGDAWLLGSVSLEFQGVTLTHAFPAEYPATIGQQWDHSLEIFHVEELPAGAGAATVTVADAAGNVMVETFDLTIDGVAPTAEITAPAAGAQVTGGLEVTVAASDPEGATTVEIYAGGALVATTTGPGASVTLDAGDFSPGPLELVAVAVDEAGNRSEAAAVEIQIL